MPREPGVRRGKEHPVQVIDILRRIVGALVVSGGPATHKPEVITAYDHEGNVVFHMVDGRVMPLNGNPPP